MRRLGSGAGCGVLRAGANVASRTREAGGPVRALLRGLRRSCRLDEGSDKAGKSRWKLPRKNGPPAQNHRGGALRGAAVRREADRDLLPPRLSARRLPSSFEGRTAANLGRIAPRECERLAV